MGNSQVGVIGLGVMGRNIALNLEDHGNTVSVYNRSENDEAHVVSDFMNTQARGKSFQGFTSIPDFTASLSSPRKVLLMVKAGKPVDYVINQLVPHLIEGDIIIDGGNSHFADTERRSNELAKQNIHFVGMGVSGGESGARNGPSLMPGCSPDTWNDIEPLLSPIAAQSFEDSPCITHVGTGGAGHFVKMVHNGIEYADMQLIAEVYDTMHRGLGMTYPEMADQLSMWNRGKLAGYLLEITSEILNTSDTDGQPLAEKILDSAGQKGTGKWTTITAFENGTHLPGITSAVSERFISSFTKLRTSLSKSLPGPHPSIRKSRKQCLSDLHDAFLASRVMCHAEGFFLMTEMNKRHDWGIKPDEIARIWQGGCIIRSVLLKTIAAAYRETESLTHLLESNNIAEMMKPLQKGWRQTIAESTTAGLPVPVMASSLSQYDSLRSGRLPANLIQAQRDFFGAHTYERVDKPRGEYFHTNWQSTR